MAQTILEMATDLTTAMVQAGQIPPGQLQDTLQKTYASLVALQRQEESGATPPAAGDWRKSISRHAVTCLECGTAFKQLARHLREHHLDARAYRNKYGIPNSQPLAARAVTARRKTIAQRVRPWEKTLWYVKAHGMKKTGRKKAAGVKG